MERRGPVLPSLCSASTLSCFPSFWLRWKPSLDSDMLRYAMQSSLPPRQPVAAGTRLHSTMTSHDTPRLERDTTGSVSNMVPIVEEQLP
jgi:hypothetical protein